jgi:hypothetical protein
VQRCVSLWISRHLLPLICTDDTDPSKKQKPYRINAEERGSSLEIVTSDRAFWILGFVAVSFTFVFLRVLCG